MLLSALLGRSDLPDIEISGISCDSRQVCPGDLFIAYRGTKFDGHLFVREAVKSGAVAICAADMPPAGFPIPWIRDPDIVRRQAELAARFYGFPADRLRIIGITGTNGKTSVAYGIAHLLDATAFMGTLGWGLPRALAETNLTTMGAVDLQRCLCELVNQRVGRVAMEVSSHALAQGRVDCVDFEGAVFTNLTRDHLDYHKSMSKYAAAKMKLFEHSNLEYAVVNYGDELGQTIISDLNARHIQCMTFGANPQADLSWTEIRHASKGSYGRWLSPWGNEEFFLPYYGSMYVSNAAAVLLTAVCNDRKFSDVVDQMRNLPPVPGRMEFIKRPGQVTVIIDYAHTPDALRHALVATRAHAQGKVYCVFGCGGDRDIGKRPEMGRVAEILADRVYLTSDNPRNESPERIVEDIFQGIADAENVAVEIDRNTAIHCAIADAGPQDVVLIAGKGREGFQEIQGRRQPFSDHTSVESALRGEDLCCYG